MDEVANLPAEERRIYFEQAAARLGYLTPQLIEKDFWVCWILKRLFSLDDLGEHLTFKGGTSLSKVYNVIDRFSEDVDLSIERAYLGFGGASEPEQGISGKEVQRRITALKQACQQCVAERLLPLLRHAIGGNLTTEQEWALTPLVDDPDSQSVEFRFPTAITDGMSPYFAPSIKLELGARSDHFPVHSATIQPYVGRALPSVIADDAVQVRVLDGERTFWEKATILHAICHQPLDKPLHKRQSRHFYDLFKMSNHTIRAAALREIGLLKRVAVHKSVFFKSAWARYDLATPGTLRLIPDSARIAELRADYREMEPMFFGPPPVMETILESLSELEREINSVPAG